MAASAPTPTAIDQAPLVVAARASDPTTLLTTEEEHHAPLQSSEAPTGEPSPGSLPDASTHTEPAVIAAMPDLAAQAPTDEASATSDAPHDATVDAHHRSAPTKLSDFLTSEHAAIDKPRYRRRSPGPHESRLPGVPEEPCASDSDGNPWSTDDTRPANHASTG